jgi:hypothetical protein
VKILPAGERARGIARESLHPETCGGKRWEESKGKLSGKRKKG